MLFFVIFSPKDFKNNCLLVLISFIKKNVVIFRYCNISCARNHWGVHMEFCKMCRHNKILREPEFNEPAFIGKFYFLCVSLKKCSEHWKPRLLIFEILSPDDKIIPLILSVVQLLSPSILAKIFRCFSRIPLDKHFARHVSFSIQILI